MADRWALIVAADKFLDPAWGTVPSAEAGAKALADALAAAGYPAVNQFTLLGPQATKTVVESRLRKLKQSVRKGDTVLAYWAGRGFSHDGAGHLVCTDTLPDDADDTAVAVADLLAALTGTKAAAVAVLLDVGAGALSPADREPSLDPGELAALFDTSPKLVGLTAGDVEEPTYAAAGLKGSVWTHLLTEAFAGRLPRAVGKDGRMTALSLHDAVSDELPRLLRKHFEAGVTQTPTLLGGRNAAAELADLSPLFGGAGGGLLDPERLKRVVFRSVSSGRVKDLSHWRKSFDVPTSAGASSKKFVARIADADVRTDLTAVFDAAREHLGYKRKDVDVTTGPDGFGSVRTPDFEYAVTAALDGDDPAKVAWTREVGQFADPGFVRGPGFDAVFGKLFDRLVFEFARPVDVAALVDRLEDSPPKGAKVQVASDGASCDVTLAGFAGRVTVDRRSLTVRGRGGHSAGLLDQFLAFLNAVGPLGEPLMLRG